MTQNPYQGPPQGYPPQQPQQGQQYPYPQAITADPAYQQGQYPPAGQPSWPGEGPPPAQYPPYPQPTPGPAQPQNVPSGGDWGDVGDPGAGLGGDGDSPALHQLENRLIFWRPRGGIVQGAAYDKTKGMEDQMRVDIIVCDGPPVPAHVSGETGAETFFAAGPKVAPFFVGNVMVNKVILDKLRDFADPINPNPRATCLARFVKTPPRGQGKPYNDLKPATEEDKTLARPIYAQWDAVKAAGQAARPDQFGGAAQPQAGGWGSYAPPPPNPYGPTVTEYPQGPPQQQGPPPRGYQPQQQNPVAMDQPGHPQQQYPPY